MSEHLRRSWAEQLMGMPISALARGEAAHSPGAHAAVHAVFAELAEVDRDFSPYRTDSAVTALKRGSVALAQCPPQVRAVAELCEQARELTGGLFDARRPDGSWDPSGYVKGWAVQRASRHLGAVPGLDWCLNAGGDVVLVCPSGQPFTVGIADPTDRTRIAAKVQCAAGAVATSGTGERGEHLYDPRTGRLTDSPWASVTVLGPDLAVADVLATAAFVAGEDWAGIVSASPGYSGLAVAPNRTMVATAGWPGPNRPPG